MTDKTHVQALPLTLTVVEAAAQMGISKRTVYTLISTGELPSLKVGSRRLLLRSTVAEYLASREDIA